MVKNREQLVAMSREWTNRAINDLRSQIIAFIEAHGTSKEELAHALTISTDEITRILNGNADITLSTFAKILIATDNVIEIKPIEATPFGQFKNMPNPIHMPMGMRNPRLEAQRQRGGMPMPSPIENVAPQTQPRDKNGRFMSTKGRGTAEPIPSYEDFMRMMENGEIPAPPMGMQPMGCRKPHGMRARHGMRPMMGDVQPIENPFSCGEVHAVVTPPRRELVSTIVDNGWDDMVDIMTSTSEELMAFLESMGLSRSHFERMANAETTSAPINESKKDAIMQMLSEELDKNPHLFEQVKKFAQAKF